MLPTAIRRVALRGAAVLCALSACSDSDKNEPEVLFSSSFERNDNPNLDEWSPVGSPEAESVMDAPPGGGLWSVSLIGGNPPSGGLATALPDVRNGDLIRVTAYVRSASLFGGADVSLLTDSTADHGYRHVRSRRSTDTAWTRVEFVDTVDARPGDSTWVKLWPLYNPIMGPRGLVDLVKVERLKRRGPITR
jgi:hypothetical protein